MFGAADFEDKANKLMSRLGSIGNIHKFKSKEEGQVIGQPTNGLRQIQQEIMHSDSINQTQLLSLSQNIGNLSSTIKAQNENRLKIDQTFNLTLNKLQRNMKNILSSMTKTFLDRQNKLNLKIQALIKAEKKQLDNLNTQLDQSLENITKLQKKVMTIIEQVNCLKKSRLQFEERIYKQFNEQIRQLKKVFEADIRLKQEKELKQLSMLKDIYKSSMEGLMNEERQRQQNEKMLMLVVEQLVNQIIQI